MLVTIAEHGIVLTRPRSFAGLMTLYEANHIRLRQLVGTPEALDDEVRSEVDRDLPLHLTVLERCRYTTALHLTYWFPTATGPVADPDLIVRVYHDARLAEACSCSPHHHHRALTPYAQEAATELDRRWLMNVMFNKWLEYCLDQQHRFPGAQRKTLKII